jgi:hypothetical protein
MHRHSSLVAFPLVPALALLSACGADDGTSAAGGGAGAGSGVPDLPEGDEPVELDPADFTTDIDNEYWPMAPGVQWTYREVDEDGEELEVVVTVSSETKDIANGITARIVRDTVTQDGELVEDTFDWYAQDADGTVWYLGEETAEFDGGEIASTEGSFEAGVDGALPGVIMPADPVDGMRFRQEYYEGEAEDNGEILSVDEQVEVAYGHFDDALLTKDTNANEPDVLEYKLYAPGVGPVLAVGISGGGGQEELVDVTRVSDEVARAAGTVPLGEPYA